MTKEEAIVILKNISWQMGSVEREQNIEAINMAIEALQTEAAQGAGRYEKAIKTLQEMPKYLNGVKAKQIKKISTDAIQGEWVCSERAVKYYGDDIVGYSYWHECSQCGSRPPKNVFTRQEWLSNYCPNCGARMKVR